jgi:drug/metabolite transporter (DMT)-like permease
MTTAPLSLAMAWPMALIVASFVVYHLVAKALRPDLDPLLFLSATYAVALAGTLALWAGKALGGGAAPQAGDLGLAVAFGLCLIGIEVGFIMAYRNGWPVSVAPTFGNVTLALAFLPVAALAFGEPITLRKVAGVAACCLGLWLLLPRGS